jgi:hypothetical protein
MGQKKGKGIWESGFVDGLEDDRTGQRRAQLPANDGDDRDEDVLQGVCVDDDPLDPPGAVRHLACQSKPVWLQGILRQGWGVPRGRSLIRQRHS